jgi:LmbE family N-acetylglucosaminyl deacetylase
MIIRFDKENSWVNHRDHINTGKIVLYASYPYARDLSFFPEHFNNPKAKSHICTEFLITDTYNHPDNVYIDMTHTLQERINAHACHKSQYSTEDAEDSADFFTANWSKGKNFEIFRHLVID